MSWPEVEKQGGLLDMQEGVHLWEGIEFLTIISHEALGNTFLVGPLVHRTF